MSDDFSGDQTAWTSTGNYASTYDPMVVCFGHSPIFGLLPSASGGLDAGGVREHTPFLVMGTGSSFSYTLYNYYGAGRDATTPSDPWRPQMAYTTDLLNWTRTGWVLPNNGLSNGTGGTNITKDCGFLHQYGSKYYFHPVIGAGGISGPGNKGLIPAGPYSSDIWEYPGIPGMGSTPIWRGAIVQFGTSGQIDAFSAYLSSIVTGPFGDQVAFIGTNDSTQTNLSVEIAVSAGPTPSPYSYTKIVGTIIPATIHLPENSDVFWHPSLNAYAHLTNEIYSPPLASTDCNACRVSPNLKDFTTLVNGPKWIQHISVADGPSAIGYLRSFRMAENAVYIDATWYMPVTYDGFPDGTSGFGLHVGRRMLLAVLEPSPRALHYTPPGSDPGHTYRKTLAHTTAITEMIADYSSFSGTTGIGYDFRIQDANNFYRWLVTLSGGISLQKFVGGTPTTLASSSGSQITYPDVHERLYFKSVGNTHTAKLDSETQVNFTDSSSPYTSGVSIGLYARGADTRFRNMHVRSSDVVTVTGLPTGVPIVFRAADIIPIESGTTTSSTYTTSTISHYPINCIQVNGVYLWLPNHALIYGGDVINYAVQGGFIGIGCATINGG